MLCYRVLVKRCKRISQKAILLVAYDGSTLVIPIWCLLAVDVRTENGFWVAAWILDKHPEFQHSDKYKADVDPKTKAVKRLTVIKYHVPKRINPVEDNGIDELRLSSDRPTD